MRALGLTAIAVIFAAATAASAAPLKRIPLMDQKLPDTTVTSVKAARIAFAPGQPTGRHRHPVAVVGLVTEGSFVFQVAGQSQRVINTGESFYEPAGAIIERFDNASSTEPAAIAAFYLLDRPDRELIEMLDR